MFHLKGEYPNPIARAQKSGKRAFRFDYIDEKLSFARLKSIGEPIWARSGWTPYKQQMARYGHHLVCLFFPYSVRCARVVVDTIGRLVWTARRESMLCLYFRYEHKECKNIHGLICTYTVELGVQPGHPNLHCFTCYGEALGKKSSMGPFIWSAPSIFFNLLFGLHISLLIVAGNTVAFLNRGKSNVCEKKKSVRKAP